MTPTQTPALAPILPAGVKDADPETLAAAAADISEDIAHLREQTRQANGTAGTALTVVGLVVAAATALLPRMDGAALVLAAIAVVLVVLAGVCVGTAVIPRPRRSPFRTPAQIAERALRRQAAPRDVLLDRATESSNLDRVVFAKNTFIRLGMWLLGLAVVVATAAAVTLAVAALS